MLKVVVSQSEKNRRQLRRQTPVLMWLSVSDMAGAMMVERAQSIPAMQPLDIQAYLAK